MSLFEECVGSLLPLALLIVPAIVGFGLFRFWQVFMRGEKNDRV